VERLPSIGEVYRVKAGAAAAELAVKLSHVAPKHIHLVLGWWVPSGGVHCVTIISGESVKGRVLLLALWQTASMHVVLLVPVNMQK
jgi:hypothetical protein